MGAIDARQGAGTFVADGPPRLGGGPLGLGLYIQYAVPASGTAKALAR